jgi:DTW domain-containing protein YfiP
LTLPRINTTTHILILRHGREAFRGTNTARLAALMLPRCRILDYAVPGLPFDIPALPPHTHLLYPDGLARTAPVEPPSWIVVLDGSWSQTRKMAHRLDILRGLPRLTLPPPVALSFLRDQVHPEGMSTLAAVATALAMLEGKDVARPLFEVHRRFVDSVNATKGIRPTVP